MPTWRSVKLNSVSCYYEHTCDVAGLMRQNGQQCSSFDEAGNSALHKHAVTHSNPTALLQAVSSNFERVSVQATLIAVQQKKLQ